MPTRIDAAGRSPAAEIALRDRPAAHSIASAVSDLLGAPPGVCVEAFDGSRALPPGPVSARIVVRSPMALRRIVTAPGELGLARAYVAGDVELDGDLFAVARAADRPRRRWQPRALVTLLAACGPGMLHPPPAPAEEARLHGRRHSRRRDAAAVTYHYDVSNEFFRIVLGPSLTYSSAVFHDEAETLERAQEHKHELVCRKLGLQPGMRLLDVGCGWGSMLLHAATQHGVRGVGVTVSTRQAELATQRIREAGLADRVEIRLQDYRDLHDGRFDAISSIGMFEHVGLRRLDCYLRTLFGLLRPGGRLLNHGISRSIRWGVTRPSHFQRRGFIDRYVFPDGELHEVGRVVSAIQRVGFEVCHVEGLRDHYARTLRRWVDNLEAGWAEAVRHAGAARARIWRLYMAACAVGFETNGTSVHQVLAVRPAGGSTGLPLRPDW